MTENKVRRETQQTIAAWCEETFGPATALRLATRANEEMAELVTRAANDPDDPKIVEELADVIITLMRVPERLGIDLLDEIDRKMQINRGRYWRRDGTGCGYHVKKETTP